MTLIRRRWTAPALLTATALALLGLAAAPADATPLGHSSRVTSYGFADPGMLIDGNRYTLFRTGSGFSSITSTSPQSGYGKPVTSMAKRPDWVSKSDPLLWAPHVFQSSYRGKPLFVMYFTGLSQAKKVHCIGVARSRYPNRGFVGYPTATLCAKKWKDGYETIDPSSYQAADGKRYLIFKLDYKNASGFDIRATQMDTTTGMRRVGTTSSVIPGQYRIEAPSVVRHGGKVWVFTSRGDYANCSYSTDVWVADRFWGAKFTRVRTVLASSKAKGICGPGGATVIEDRTATRIVYHAYRDANGNGVRDSSTRRAYVGQLVWKSDGPHLY